MRTLYVTAYSSPPLGERFSGQAARAPSGQSILPRSAMGRYWRIETAGAPGAFTLDLCLEASALSEAEALATVFIQRNHETTGRWTPHDTHLEMHDGARFACADAVVPSGDFSFGSGDEAAVAMPPLLTPENDATDVDLSAALIWQPVPDAYSYDLQVASDPGFTSLLTDSSGIADTMLIPDSLSRNALHYWRVRGVTVGGVVGPWSTAFRFVTGNTGVGAEDETPPPPRFALEANYPNPFNPQTTIEFVLPGASAVRLVVYDMLGREVTTLVDGRRLAGRHRVTFEAANLPSGVYFYRLEAEAFTLTRQMLLVK